MDDTGKKLTELETRVAGISTGRRIAIVQYQTAKNVAAGTFTATAWSVYPLNTIVHDSIGIVVANNAVALPEGNYLVQAFVPGHDTGNIRLCLRLANGQHLAYGSTQRSGSGGDTAQLATLFAVISLTSQMALQLCYYAASAGNMGTSLNVAPEVWGSILFERI